MMQFYAINARRGHSMLDLTGPDEYPFQNSPDGDPFRSLPENCGDSTAGWQKPVTGHARRGEEQTGWDVSVKRPGCRVLVSTDSECKNPLIPLNFGGLARNQGVQKQALCL